jgi:hypothetical protein
MYLHWRGVVLVFFGCGYCGFFTVLRGGDKSGDGCDDGRGNDEDVAVVTVAVGDGVLALPTLDVVVFVLAISEEDGSVGVWSVAGRLTSSALFFSCSMYALNRKSSAQVSTTIFQNGGSACTVFAESSWRGSWKVGFCLFHISKRGRGVKDVASDSRASATLEVVIIGGSVVDVVVVSIADGGIMVRRCRHERGAKNWWRVALSTTRLYVNLCQSSSF